MTTNFTSTLTTIWSDFPKGGWEATVQESGLEQRNRSRRYGWWSSRSGMWVGKSTISVRSCTIENSWQNRPVTSVVWEWQNYLVLWALKSPHTMTLAEGWRISILSILDDTASTTEQNDEDGEWYMKYMKVVEHIRLIFILTNSLLSNQKIALNINTKAVHMSSILAMDWQVSR